MAGLNLTNIYKVYPNGTKAVNDFSMDIEDKEFIVFVGPSGCGKSTVLRMIAGLEEISAGELKIDGSVVNDVDCKNRDTAMVFQNYALYPHMSVADNMAFPLKMTKLNREQKAQLKERVDKKYPPVLSAQKCEKDAEYRDLKARNAEVRKKYKEDKKVVLTKEDKIAVSEKVKNEYPKSLKNSVLKPLHYLAAKREYKTRIREERNLVRPISVLNNILKPFHVSFMKREEMYAKVIKIAEILGLEEYLGKRPGAMSGGQRQRVALGRAMVRNPKVFLLDEPLSNLDAKLRTQMRSEITKLHNRLQTTFIYVTHDQTEAMTMGDRIVVMKKGRIQQTDTPVNLYSYPENLFVAGFIGTPSMNFFDATVESDGENASVSFAGGKKLSFSAEHIKKFERKYLGKELVLGVRPEDFKVSEDGVECVVLNIEMLGSETLLYCDFDTENVTNYESGKYPFIVKAEGVCRRRCGERIKVAIDFERAHYFDKDSEESVMKRFVSYNEIPAVVSGGKLSVGGLAASLPPALENLDGEFVLTFPTSAITCDGDLEAEALECERLSQGWLTRISLGGQKLYALFASERTGKIKVGVDWSEVTFSRGGEIIKPALTKENVFSVTLNKRALGSEEKKALPDGEKRNFDAEVKRGETSLVCPVPVLKRILGASDRKLFGTDMRLIFGEDGVTDEKIFKASIKEIYDYGNRRYAVCACGDSEIVLPYNGESGEMCFGIDLLKASIYDNYSGIRIA